MRVSLFVPCLSEHLYPQAALAMVKVLRHLGADIDYVDGQTCCGQPAFNSGYRDEIIPVAERFIEMFADREAVVAPSGSCVAMVRKFYHDLDIHPRLTEARDRLSRRIYEFTEFIVDVMNTKEPGGSFPHRITYHDSCHLNRELGIYRQPRQLIRSISDIDFVEMPQPDLCCGFGGTFSVKFPELSIAMTERKCRNIEDSGADYCIGADSSCLMNIEGYLRRHG
ncbi:MAG TPA: (Fe-S)-binding protein, partial [Acidobacteriota bacterium]|nr:(Fe-S)-binding protein [Acidobacteriota bacterium]